jgi:hypothetical protein
MGIPTVYFAGLRIGLKNGCYRASLTVHLFFGLNKIVFSSKSTASYGAFGNFYKKLAFGCLSNDFKYYRAFGSFTN